MPLIGAAALGVASTTVLAAPSAADADFNARCTAAGVIRCEPLDTLPSKASGSVPASIPAGYFAGDQSAPVIDATIKTSGAGSVKFTVLGKSGANAAGSLFFNFANDYSQRVGENSDVYVQWRQRFSSEMLAGYMGGEGWKQLIIGAGSQSGNPQGPCSALAIVSTNLYYSGFPSMHNTCSGAGSLRVPGGFYEPLGASDFKLQNDRSAPYCLYSQKTTGYLPLGGNCFGYVANEWMTFQIHIKTGPRVGDAFRNSYVELWVAREGQASQRVINWGPYSLSAGASADNLQYGQVWLLPYDKAKNPAVTHPDAATWYSELIISRNRIADPLPTASFAQSAAGAPQILAAPTQLSAAAVSSTQINLSWAAAGADAGISTYYVYVGGVLKGVVSGTSYAASGLSANTVYSFTVQAVNAAGNRSAQSNAATASTQAASASTPDATAAGAGGVAVSTAARVKAFAATSSTAAVTSFDLTSAVGGVQDFTVGLGFKKGDIPGTPVLGIPDQQVIVMRRWNDGSVKHAIASGRVALAANVPTTVGVSNSTSTAAATSLTAASIQAANPQASVQFGSYGTVNLSALLATPFRTFVAGPEMVEAHYRAQVGSDATLVAWFHVRLYKDGKLWVRAIGENGYLDVATTSKSYTPTVSIGGATVWNNGGAAFTHYAHTRWAQEAWIGGDPQVVPKHDTAYLKRSGLVPNYMAATPSASTLNGLYQSYAPNQNGGWTTLMGEAGYQDQIGVLPRWDALYITSGADARAYKSVIANSKALNSYPVVWNDSVTKTTIKPSDRANWSLDGPNQGGSTNYGAGSLNWEVAHHGSGGYLAYLITGDYYHLETMADQASVGYLMAGPTNWGTTPASTNYGTSRLFNGQTRGYAWNLRTLSQYAAIVPAGNALAADYQALLASNMAYLKTVKDSVVPAGIGYLYEYNLGAYGVGLVAPWQHHFFMQSLGAGSDLEPLADMGNYNQVRDYMYRGAVGILGDATGYCFTQASEYVIKDNDGTAASAVPNGWYKNWAQVYNATYATPPACGNTLAGGGGGHPSVAATGYWGNLMPAIAYAVDHGAPGAAAAWSRLSGASNWSVVLGSGFADIPQWGIVPRQSTATPPPPVVVTSFALTVSTTGSGSVVSTPAGINCGAICSANFASGASVALAATPASGYKFTGWGGACSGVGTCTVAMDAAKNVTAGFAPVVAAPSQLVAAYSFDEASGSALDSSVNGNVASITGATRVAGKHGSAVSFAKSGDKVIAQTSPQTAFAGSMTLEAWILPSSLPTTGKPIILKGASWPQNYALQLEGNRLLWTWAGGSRYYYSSPVVQVNAWQHVAFTYDAVSHQTMFYVNGAAAGADVENAAPTAVSGPLYIGSNESTAFFPGAIDDVRVYHAVLSQAQVQADMAAGVGTSGGVAPPPAPTVPGNVSGTATSSTSITLTWNAATSSVGISGYKVYRDGVSVGTTLATSFSQTNLAPNATYAYAVSAVDTAGTEGAQSAAVSIKTPAIADTVAPSVPGGLVASGISTSQIAVSWIASTDNVGVTGYEVFRNGTSIASVGGAITSYGDTGLAANTTYTYTVRAKDAAGNASAQTPGVSAKTLAGTTGTTGVTPAWMQGQVVGEWRQIPNTALSGVPMAVSTYPTLGMNGPASKITAWTGLAIDPRDSSIYSAANGGHADYAGNEVDRIRISDNAPAWTEVRSATPAAQITQDADHYADGRPTSRHSYYGAMFSVQRNRVMLVAGVRWGIGVVGPSVDGFNPAVNDWDAANTYPDVPSEVKSMPGVAIVEQDTTGDIFAFAGWTVARWSNATNTWSRVLTNTSVYGLYAASAFDSRRNRILIIAGANNEHYVYDIASNTLQPMTLTGADAAGVTGSYEGMVYDAGTDQYLFKRDNDAGAVYAINPQTFAVTKLATAAASPVPNAINGVHRRFLYVPQLGGVAYAPTYSDNMWFLRTK